jgi:UDPglucose 6-dehydrogenase
MREAISIKIVNNLLNEGAKIVAYDPAAMDNAREVFGKDIQYANSAIQCLKNADCCILTTEWEEFKKLTPEDFIQHMKNPTIIDGRRIYDPKQFSQKLKFKAIGLGTLT